MKGFFSGLLVGLLLTTTVFASSEQIQAVFADFNFVINGQVQKVQTKPIVYNGTSYLPVRDIANLLGYDVDYKTDTRTIELNNTKEVKVMQEQFISARELSTLGVEIIIPDPKVQLVILNYKNVSFETSDYEIIDGQMFFKKDILNELGI